MHLYSKSYSILFIIVTFTLCIVACKEDKPTIPVEEKQEIVPLVHHEAYVVMVDNLRMRSAAGLKSEVVRKLPEGTIVLSDGTQSDFTDQITLRGIRYDAPYQNIYLKNDEEQIGWAYRGALLKIFHDDKQYPFSNHLDVLLTSLLQKDYKSVEDLVQMVSVLSKENASSPAWNDVLFVVGRRIIETFLFDYYKEASTVDYEWKEEDYQAIAKHNFDYSSNSKTRAIQQAGLQLDAQEGMIALELASAQLAKNIGGPYTPVIEDYIEIETKKGAQQITSDASIVASISRLVDIFILQDDFLNTYSNYDVFWEEVTEDRETYRKMIVEGTSNTPAIIDGGTTISPEFIEGWNYLLKQYPKHPLATEVKAKLEQVNE